MRNIPKIPNDSFHITDNNIAAPYRATEIEYSMLDDINIKEITLTNNSVAVLLYKDYWHKHMFELKDGHFLLIHYERNGTSMNIKKEIS